MSTLPEKLKKLQCPINWGLDKIPWTSKNGKERILDKLDGDFDDNDSSSTWQKFSQRLMLAFLEYNEEGGDIRKMKNYLDMIDNILTNNKFEFVIKYLDAIQYVLNGMLAHYHYQENHDTLAETYVSKVAFEDLPARIKAGIFSLKSCCIMEFGPGESSKDALKAIKIALEWDPDEAEWWFLKGKCLARARRYRRIRSPPTEEELAALKRSGRSSALPSHLVFCGQSVLEYALYAPECQGRDNLHRRLSYQNECVGLMRTAANLGENNAIILCRVAKGLMAQHGEGVDEILERCVKKSLELLSSSGMVNEIAGDYYRSHENNIDKAMRHYTIAAHQHDIGSAYLKMFDLMLLTKTDSELDNEVRRYWNKRKDNPLGKLRALRPMTAYCFFVKNDLVQAVKYWNEYIVSTYLITELESSHTNGTFVWTDDLTKDIVGEVLLKLKNSKNNLTTDDEETLRSLLHTLTDARPDIDLERIESSREARIRKYLDTMKNASKKKVLQEKFNIRVGNLDQAPKRSTWRGGARN